MQVRQPPREVVHELAPLCLGDAVVGVGVAAPGARGVWVPLLFFFNDTATTEIYTLSLHDALPIRRQLRVDCSSRLRDDVGPGLVSRSEEHTSELQSRQYLVCRLLLEKKKKKQ